MLILTNPKVHRIVYFFELCRIFLKSCVTKAIIFRRRRLNKSKYTQTCIIHVTLNAHRTATLALWPVVLALHASSFCPPWGFDPTRNFCVQCYTSTMNMCTCSTILVAVIAIVGSLSFWLSRRCCFPPWAAGQFVVDIKRLQCLIAVSFGMLPSFGLLIYCEFLHGCDCPGIIQDLAEVADSWILLLIFVALRYLGVGRWNDVLELGNDACAGAMLDESQKTSSSHSLQVSSWTFEQSSWSQTSRPK